MQIRPFQMEDETGVIRLWQDCGLVVPHNDPHRDIACKLAMQPDWFLVGCVDQKLIASAMAGYDGHRGWIYYLAVHPEYQKKGYGRLILAEAENILKAAGCPKINLMVRTSNRKTIEFYRHIGFERSDVITLGKRLDDPR